MARSSTSCAPNCAFAANAFHAPLPCSHSDALRSQKVHTRSAVLAAELYSCDWRRSSVGNSSTTTPIQNAVLMRNIGMPQRIVMIPTDPSNSLNRRNIYKPSTVN